LGSTFGISFGAVGFAGTITAGAAAQPPQPVSQLEAQHDFFEARRALILSSRPIFFLAQGSQQVGAGAGGQQVGAGAGAGQQLGADEQHDFFEAMRALILSSRLGHGLLQGSPQVPQLGAGAQALHPPA
jgi:hypothetical protein